MKCPTILKIAFAAAGVSLYCQDITLPQKPDSVRFAVIGDMGTGKKPQYELAAKMAAFHGKFPFEFVLMMGDNLYGGDGPGDYRAKFEQPYKPLLDAGVKFYAALGNHDNPNQKFYKPFNMGGQQYYTYKKGNVRFFVLDTSYMNPQQLMWLEKELGNSGSDWLIPYFHHAIYSSARFHGSSTEHRLVLEPLFVKYGVQIVFAGHDHVYERVKPQKGIHYFTVGSSGALRAGNLRKSQLTAFGYDKDLAFMLIEIAGDELHFQTISRAGHTVDSGTIRRIAIDSVARPTEKTKAGAPEN